MSDAATSANKLIVIGENIHTTRVLQRKGPRIATVGDKEVIKFTTAGGEEKVLTVPDSAKKGQDWEQGRVKHVKAAIDAAMEGGPEAALGIEFLHGMAASQERNGAHFLDLNVDEISLKAEGQQAAMAWLVRTMEGLTGLPLSIDSSSVEVIEAGFKALSGKGPRTMLNSASQERLDALDLAKAYNAPVVITAAGEKGMPDGVEPRVANATIMVEAAQKRGIPLADLYIDPLIFPVSVDTAYGPHSLDAIRAMREKFGPEIHITGGMSNVSFGIPSRRLINEVFLVLAAEAGADSAIMDPVVSNPANLAKLDRSTPAWKLAEDVILDRDRHCRAYLKAWRKGELKA
ncbi:MAG: dihydropteroate synthase [Alphaproteobacteria bacterium]